MAKANSTVPMMPSTWPIRASVSPRYWPLLAFTALIALVPEIHAKGLAKRLEGTGVTAVSVHPGWVRTSLAKHSMPLWVQDYVLRPFLRLGGMIEPWEGAQTTLHCLLSDDIPNHPGAFFSQTGTYRDRSKNGGGWPLRSPNPKANDDALVEALWKKSEALVSPA